MTPADASGGDEPAEPREPDENPDERSESSRLPDQPGAIAARLSVDEIAYLAARLGLTPPPSVVRAVLSFGEDPAAPPEDVVTGAVGRGLLARGVLSAGKGSDDEDAEEAQPDEVAVHEVAMDDDVRAILTIICRPSSVITVTTDRRPAAQQRIIYAAPDGCMVETERAIGGRGVLEYLSMPVRSILPSVMHWTGLDRHPAEELTQNPSETVSFTVVAADAVQATRAVADGDVHAGVTILQVAASAQVESGAEAVRASAAAAAYVRARASSHIGSRSVTVTRSFDDRLAVTRVFWSDCGAAGLWLVEQDDALPPAIPDTETFDERTRALEQISLGAPLTLTLITREALTARISAVAS